MYCYCCFCHRCHHPVLFFLRLFHDIPFMVLLNFELFCIFFVCLLIFLMNLFSNPIFQVTECSYAPVFFRTLVTKHVLYTQVTVVLRMGSLVFI